MAIDKVTLVRKRIGDEKKIETESFKIGTESTTVQLAHGNVGIFNVYDRNVQTAPLEPITDYNLDAEAGVLTLGYVPQDDSTMTVVYYY